MALSWVVSSPALLALTGLLGLAPTDAIYFNRQPQCRPFETVVSSMRASPMSAVVQAANCAELRACVDSSHKEVQDAAAAAGVLEAIVDALKNHQLNKIVYDQCIGAIGRPILFNRENGLRAGQLGGLNLTLAAYERWLDDPLITVHGGDIGCFQDFVPENRAILRELGGVELLIQNIRNNFHGKYSDWHADSVTNSLFGLSSGTWNNADVAYKAGFIPLSLQLMNEKGSVVKIAEETLQAVKAMFWQLPGVRREFSQQGLAKTLAKVLHENSEDRGATSLACLTTANLIGPSMIGGPMTMPHMLSRHDPEIRANATRDGLLDQLLATATSRTKLEHHDHESFNFDVDASYDASADCFEALRTFTTDSSTNVQHMLTAGLAESLLTQLAGTRLDLRAKGEACLLLRGLTPGQSSTAENTLALQVNTACSGIQQQP